MRTGDRKCVCVWEGEFYIGCSGPALMRSQRLSRDVEEGSEWGWPVSG